jgi:hypothetical protein
MKHTMEESVRDGTNKIPESQNDCSQIDKASSHSIVGMWRTMATVESPSLNVSKWPKEPKRT